MRTNIYFRETDLWTKYFNFIKTDFFFSSKNRTRANKRRCVWTKTAVRDSHSWIMRVCQSLKGIKRIICVRTHTIKVSFLNATNERKKSVFGPHRTNNSGYFLSSLNTGRKRFFGRFLWVKWVFPLLFFQIHTRSRAFSPRKIGFFLSKLPKTILAGVVGLPHSVFFPSHLYFLIEITAAFGSFFLPSCSRLVDSAVHDRRDLLRASALPSDVGHLVEGVQAGDDVTEDARELGVHVGKDDAELRSHLKQRSEGLDKGKGTGFLASLFTCWQLQKREVE